jgi:hypothetical protein
LGARSGEAGELVGEAEAVAMARIRVWLFRSASETVTKVAREVVRA